MSSATLRHALQFGGAAAIRRSVLPKLHAKPLQVTGGILLRLEDLSLLPSFFLPFSIFPTFMLLTAMNTEHIDDGYTILLPTQELIRCVYSCHIQRVGWPTASIMTFSLSLFFPSRTLNSLR